MWRLATQKQKKEWKKIRSFFLPLMPVFTEGEGVGPDNEKEPTSYDEEVGMIRAAAQGTEITYTVPEGVEGTYDMYLTVSKVLAAFSSQPFTFTINGEDTFSVPVDLQVPG